MRKIQPQEPYGSVIDRFGIENKEFIEARKTTPPKLTFQQAAQLSILKEVDNKIFPIN